VVIRLSADLARIGIYPTVDPLNSRSRLLEDRIADRNHVELAARIRDAIRPLLSGSGKGQPAGDPLTLQRARKLLRFFAQPFYVAEP
jgi:F0F1-type ATP synthase beta subunit